MLMAGNDRSEKSVLAVVTGGSRDQPLEGLTGFCARLGVPRQVLAQLANPGIEMQDLVLESDPPDLVRESRLQADRRSVDLEHLVLNLDPDGLDAALLLEEPPFALNPDHPGQGCLELHRQGVHEGVEISGVGPDRGSQHVKAKALIAALTLVHSSPSIGWGIYHSCTVVLG